MNFPENLRYSAEHEWIRLEGSTGYIGITEFAQQELGDIVFIDINSVDKTVGQNEVFGTVEAVKTVSDLFMPVGGKVIEMNSALEGSPELVNSDPYGEGWIVKVELTDPAQVDGLMTAEAYRQLVGA